MATNNDGHLLATDGNVAIDFVWGNMPIQPNDDRPNALANRLDPALDNHIIALSGWNGYPQFTANSAGVDVLGAVDYVVVPEVRGFATASAQDAMLDASLVVITASGATNTATQPTRINVTATTAATVYVSGGTSTWPASTKVTISAGTGIPTALVGSWTVTGGSGSTLTISGSGWTVADTSSITPGTQLKGTPATIKVQNIAAGAATTAPGTTVTLTPWA